MQHNNPKEIKLNEQQAYIAMYHFLDNYYWRTHSDDVASFLSGMSTLCDGGTADPAIWSDWIKSVKHLFEPSENIKQKIPFTLTVQQAFTAARYFLNSFATLTSSEDIGKIVKGMQIQTDGKIADQKMWDEFKKCVEQVLENNETLDCIRLQLFPPDRTIQNEHCCKQMYDSLVDTRIPIGYSPLIREYYIQLKQQSTVQPISFCPWCGKKLPASLREEYFKSLEKEHHISQNINEENIKNFPKDFQSDAWWKKRSDLVNKKD